MLLEQVGLDDSALCGNKAVFLAELKRLGYFVPDAVVLPTSVFDLFLQQNDLSTWLSECADESDTADAARLLEIEREVEERFSKGHLPEQVYGQVSSWCEAPHRPVSVRSSATKEDIAGNSFAGMYSSVLHVDRDGLHAAILHCFASLFSARAWLYRRRAMQARSSAGRMAVLIQTMLASHWAGVCFTRAPRQEDLLLVECAPGLGDGIAGGFVAPSRFYIDRATMQMKDAKEKHTVDREMVLEIARTALAIEQSLGRPQDIEYSVVKSKTYILQARPLSK